jgi:CheY-like chemotaxis protein
LEADSSAAALDAFNRSRPDLIVSDLGLPGEDGYMLIRRIRGREAQLGCAAVPAVALSAFARDMDRQRAVEAGFQEHISKPIEPRQILMALSALAQMRP